MNGATIVATKSRGSNDGSRDAFRPQTLRTLRLILAALVAMADLIAKAWAQSTLSHGKMLWIWKPWVQLMLLHNRGAMLGIGANVPAVVVVVSMVGVGVLIYWIWRDGIGATGAAIMLGGGVGNLASRLANGYVTDFIHVTFWPGVFDLADVALRAGALVGLFALWQHSRRAQSSA